MPALLTIRQAAERLGVSEKTVDRRIADGKLSVVRDGRLVRIEPAALEAYIAAHRSSKERWAPPELISPGQLSAFHAKLHELELLLEHERSCRCRKQRALATASLVFEREISSAKELTRAEASELLDSLEDQVAELREESEG